MAAEGFAEYLLLFSCFDKQKFCFVVVVEVHFFLLAFHCLLFGKADFNTFRENRKGCTKVTENTNCHEIQENTKRPLGKHKQNQLPT